MLTKRDDEIRELKSLQQRRAGSIVLWKQIPEDLRVTAKELEAHAEILSFEEYAPRLIDHLIVVLKTSEAALTKAEERVRELEGAEDTKAKTLDLVRTLFARYVSAQR